MSILGLVVEYNPFHNGHLHHLQRSKKISEADGVICVMSGNFIQRGEPAIVNKWARTKMALQAGADLIIELPAVYAMASAEFFAYGAVKILDSMGIVDCLCFGSEKGKLDGLKAAAELLAAEPDEYKEHLKRYLGQGLSYPAAREEAIKEYLKYCNYDGHDFEEILAQPNNILGIEYIKSLYKLNSNIKPLTIKRTGNNYNQQELSGILSSATSIRKNIYESYEDGSEIKLDSFMPESSINILKDEFRSARGPVYPEHFEKIILAALRQKSAEQISKMPYVTEGLENRIKRAADTSGTLNELIDKICTRRYTRTRIQRCVFSTITGLTGQMFDKFNIYGGPQYIRVLGFNERGRELLRQMREKASLPVITKTADFKHSHNPLIKSMLSIEAASTDIYVLSYNDTKSRLAGQEFTQNVVIV